MATVKTVSVNYERKINLGNYESAAIGCTIWADVKEDEDLHTAMTDLWSMAKENVRAQVLPLMPKNGNNVSTNIKDLFLGLPVEQAKEIE